MDDTIIKKIQEQLNYLESSHANCVNFLGKAYMEKSRDRLESGWYFHETFNNQLKVIKELIENSSQSTPEVLIKTPKYKI